MKKIVLITILSFLLLSFGIQILAQEVGLPSPGFLPDNLFYFLETIAEWIGTFFTFGDLKKAERHIALAAERLAEAQAVVEKGKPEFAEKTLERYEMQLEKSMARVEKAQSKGQNTEQVMTRVGKATSIHLEVLAEVYEKVPEQAKPAIERAMITLVKGHEKVVEALKAQNALGEIPETVSLSEKVPQEVRERVQGKAQEELKKERVQEKIQEELEEEKILQSSKSTRTICIEMGGGGPSEMCEKIPLQGFESFESYKAWCLEIGGVPELCASFESTCKEFGLTTADKCFRVLSNPETWRE